MYQETRLDESSRHTSRSTIGIHEEYRMRVLLTIFENLVVWGFEDMISTDAKNNN